jgi:Fe-S-cluster-containing hydrogenase component 2
MNARTIDTDKCIGCGKCVTDCICNYLVISEIGGVSTRQVAEKEAAV